MFAEMLPPIEYLSKLAIYKPANLNGRIPFGNPPDPLLGMQS